MNYQKKKKRQIPTDIKEINGCLRMVMGLGSYVTVCKSELNKTDLNKVKTERLVPGSA